MWPLAERRQVSTVRLGELGELGELRVLQVSSFLSRQPQDLKGREKAATQLRNRRASVRGGELGRWPPGGADADGFDGGGGKSDGDFRLLVGPEIEVCDSCEVGFGNIFDSTVTGNAFSRRAYFGKSCARKAKRFGPTQCHRKCVRRRSRGEALRSKRNCASDFSRARESNR